MEYGNSIQNYVTFFGDFFPYFSVDILCEICLGKIGFRIVANGEKRQNDIAPSSSETGLVLSAVAFSAVFRDAGCGFSQELDRFGLAC